MSFVRFGLLAAFLIYLVLFVVKNLSPTEVNLLFATVGPVPLSLVVITAGVLGALCTGAALAWPVVRSRVRGRQTSRRIAQLEQEIHGLRTLPLTRGVADETEESSGSDAGIPVQDG